MCECSAETVEIRDACLSIDAFEVSVFPFSVAGFEVSDNATSASGCDKMSLCGKVEQTKEILFHAFDNRLRDNATLSTVMHIGQDVRNLPITQLESYVYEFGFSHNYRGVAILEIYVDGVQIPESPIRVEVAPRECNIDFPGENKIAVSLYSLVEKNAYTTTTFANSLLTEFFWSMWMFGRFH